jgi:hypothetical protein
LPFAPDSLTQGIRRGSIRAFRKTPHGAWSGDFAMGRAGKPRTLARALAACRHRADLLRAFLRAAAARLLGHLATVRLPPIWRGMMASRPAANCCAWFAEARYGKDSLVSPLRVSSSDSW